MLAGCVFIIAGAFKGGQNKASLEKLVYDNGGTVSTKICGGVTHLLISDNEFIKQGPKTKAVLEHNERQPESRIWLVDPGWLLESIDNDQRAPEEEWDLSLLTNDSDAEQDRLERERMEAKRSQKKRKRETSVAEASTPTAASQDSSAEIIKGVLVTVDGPCPLADKAHVHYDDDQTYWHAYLQKTADNKFAIMQLLKSDTKNLYWVWIRSGPQGSEGKSTTFGPCGNEAEAIAHFDKKFRDRTKLRWAQRLTAKPEVDRYMFVKPDADYEAEDLDFDDSMFDEIDAIAAGKTQDQEGSIADYDEQQGERKRSASLEDEDEDPSDSKRVKLAQPDKTESEVCIKTEGVKAEDEIRVKPEPI